MITRPTTAEAASYYFPYIDLVPEGDVVTTMAGQLAEIDSFLMKIDEAQSLQSYAPDKWTIRQVWNHVNDTERVFVYRAMWFARGFSEPLPGYDQNIGVAGGEANNVPWNDLIEEFRHVRLATLSFFRNLPEAAWSRTGIASDNSFTVRALAYIIGGHATHHQRVIRDRYL